MTNFHQIKDHRKRKNNTSSLNDQRKKNRIKSNLRSHERKKNMLRKHVSWRENSRKTQVRIKKSDWMKIVALLQEPEVTIQSITENENMNTITSQQN